MPSIHAHSSNILSLPFTKCAILYTINTGNGVPKTKNNAKKATNKLIIFKAGCFLINIGPVSSLSTSCGVNTHIHEDYWIVEVEERMFELDIDRLFIEAGCWMNNRENPLAREPTATRAAASGRVLQSGGALSGVQGPLPGCRM